MEPLLNRISEFLEIFVLGGLALVVAYYFLVTIHPFKDAMESYYSRFLSILVDGVLKQIRLVRGSAIIALFLLIAAGVKAILSLFTSVFATIVLLLAWLGRVAWLGEPTFLYRATESLYRWTIDYKNRFWREESGAGASDGGPDLSQGVTAWRGVFSIALRRVFLPSFLTLILAITVYVASMNSFVMAEWEYHVIAHEGARVLQGGQPGPLP